MPQQNKEQEYIEKAHECLNKLNYFGLINNLQHLISLNPDNPNPHYHFQLAEAYRKLLKVYCERDYYFNAIKNYTYAITLDPQEPQYYYKRAKILLLKHHKSKALTDLTSALALDRDNIHYLKLRASLAFELGKLEIALQDYLQLSKHDPDDVMFRQKAAEIQQKLPKTTLSPAETTQAAVEETKHKQLNIAGFAWPTVIALSALVGLAGLVLSVMGMLTLAWGVTLAVVSGVVCFGAACLWATDETSNMQLAEREQDKQIDTPNIKLDKPLPTNKTHGKTISIELPLRRATTSVDGLVNTPTSGILLRRGFNYGSPITPTEHNTHEATSPISIISPPCV